MNKIDPVTNPLDKLPALLKKNLDKNLCVCNEVPKMDIINAIVNGATTVAEIKKQTYATMGRGCCKQQVKRLIECLCSPDTEESLSSPLFKNKLYEVEMSHPVIEDLLWRKTTKKYNTDKKVSEEDLNVLFEAMRLSASSINSQPWKFVVIESEEARERMHKTFSRMHAYNQPHVFESSQFILFAHNPYYTRDDYAKVVDKGVEDKRTKPENREAAFAAFGFAEANTDEKGYTGCWTKAQTYIVLGNTLHTLARLKIDSTPIEGIDTELVNKEFKKELDGYWCDVALAIGYHHADDFNTELPKSRLQMDNVLMRI